MLLDQFAQAIDLLIPTGRADHHVLARMNAGCNVRHDGVRRGEVDHDLDAAEIIWSQRGAGGIFFRPRDAHVMLALGGHFGNERPGFSATKNEEIHGTEDLTTEGHCAVQVPRSRNVSETWGTLGPKESREHFLIQFREERFVQALDHIGHFVFFDHEREINFRGALRDHANLFVGEFAEH